VANAGRSIAPLQVGQTFEAIIENPTAFQYYRGYSVGLLNNTNNDVAGGSKAGEQVSAYIFHQFDNNWRVGDGAQNTIVPNILDSDTAVAGARLEITLTSANDYFLTLTPLNNPANAYSQSGPLKLPGQPINWIQCQFFNTAEDSNSATDFYISSMTIGWMSLSIQSAGTNVVLSWPATDPAFNLISSTNVLAPGADWVSINTSPVVANGLNFVTNPVLGTRLFYRLKQ
jgi:hypothetical protein